METVALRREVTRVIAARVTPVTPTLLARRALPAAGLRGVGPWILLDHFGPLPSAPEARGDTLTYLLQDAGAGMVHGLQLGARPPLVPAGIRRLATAALDPFRTGDAQVRVLAGELRGRRGPFAGLALLAHVAFAGRGRASFELPPGIELAAYVALGQARFGEVEADAGKLLRFAREGAGIEAANDLDERADVLLLGGAPLGG
jgi:redox-sensitive bicupin YhaK (pirin superfamily)